MCNFKKKTVDEFLNENTPCLIEKWDRKLQEEIVAEKNSCAANGLSGTPRYLRAINKLMINNVEALIKELIEISLYAIFSEKIVAPNSKKFEETLGQKIDSVLKEHEKFLAKEAKLYNISFDGKVESRLKRELSENTEVNLFLLLNKFSADLFEKNIIKNSEKRSIYAFRISVVSIAISFASLIVSNFGQWKKILIYLASYI